MMLSPDRWQFYKDRPGQWQWRKFKANKVVAVSYDAFFSRRACIDDAKTRGYVTEPNDLLHKAHA